MLYFLCVFSGTLSCNSTEQPPCTNMNIAKPKINRWKSQSARHACPELLGNNTKSSAISMRLRQLSAPKSRRRWIRGWTSPGKQEHDQRSCVSNGIGGSGWKGAFPSRTPVPVPCVCDAEAVRSGDCVEWVCGWRCGVVFAWRCWQTWTACDVRNENRWGFRGRSARAARQPGRLDYERKIVVWCDMLWIVKLTSRLKLFCSKNPWPSPLLQTFVAMGWGKIRWQLCKKKVKCL